MSHESSSKTLLVAFVLAVVCSILVSTAAVMLKPKQDENQKNERKKNVLIAAGIYEEGDNIAEKYKMITPIFINLKTGEITDNKDVDGYFANFNRLSSAVSINKTEDLAQIVTTAKEAPAFLLKENGNVKKLILPIYGKGLWSTIYGFLSLENDFKTVSGITFYSHGETPGLGGEIENKKWRDGWKAKKVLNNTLDPSFMVVKGGIDKASPKAVYQIDSLSGATITSKSVENMINFWIGKNGFGNFIKKASKEGLK